MTGVEIREVDPRDEEVLHQWWETSHAAWAGRPYDVYPPWTLSRVALATPNSDWHWLLLGAFDGDRMLGSAMVELPQLDNLANVYAEVTVPPEHRRRGIGSRLLADVEARAVALGRKRVLGESYGRPGETVPGDGFAATHGYAVANREGFKVVELATSAPSWPALDERVDQRIGDYRIVGWRDHTPDEYVAELCAALSRFLSMVPIGDLALEDGEWTPERLREHEKRNEVLGREEYSAAAVAADGTLAGYSGLTVSPGQTHQAAVGVTMVLPEHRGHSLGLAMKLASHRALMADHPECEIVRTSNADANPHMNAVNEAMGYRIVEELRELQKEL
jgi:GNAT superfamily N-acetyltransferase